MQVDSSEDLGQAYREAVKTVKTKMVDISHVLAANDNFISLASLMAAFQPCG